ncbi:hypothetical protein Tco_0365274 [Tanacetum coccineum]
MRHQFNQFSQQQQPPNQAIASQPQSDQQSFHLVDETEDENEEEPVLTPTSKKKRGIRLKTKAKKIKKRKHNRNLWSQDEKLILAKSFIHIFEDPKTGCDQKNETFWYKIIDVYNAEATRRGYMERTKNMLTGKWTPMNENVQKFNQLVGETLVHSEENDDDWMTRTSTSGKIPKHFGEDALPRPPRLQRISKSQRSSNSTASSGSNPLMYQEMMKEQYELDCKAKMKVIERETNERMRLYHSQRIAEDMKVLQIDTRGMDPVDAAIINAQKARVAAMFAAPPDIRHNADHECEKGFDLMAHIFKKQRVADENADVPKQQSETSARIAPVAIIDRQLPFEYTIASRSTDVMVLLGKCLKEKKLSGLNFNDWFRSPKLVLRVKKKLSIIEQPISPAPPTDSIAQVLARWNAVYEAHNEVACLMLRKEGKSVSSYVLKMKGYVKQLKRFGYVLPQDLSVGLIMNGLTSDFAGFVRNYNMHNMGKTIGELHVMLIKYKKGLPKKVATP